MSSRHQSLLTMGATLVCLTTLTATPMTLGASPENDCFYDALLLPDACTPGILQATTGCDSNGCLPLIPYGHSEGMGSSAGSPLTQSAPSTGIGQGPSAGFQPGGLQGGALMASSSVAAQSNVGYIDLAVPVTMFRLRYDAASGNEFPDRADSFMRSVAVPVVLVLVTLTFLQPTMHSTTRICERHSSTHSATGFLHSSRCRSGSSIPN